MNILMLGDVVGQNGCNFLCKRLPELRRRLNVDLTIVNGENAADGNGITPVNVRAMNDAGADIITLGNHALRRREIYPVLEEGEGIVRPANFHPSAPGCGLYVYDRPGLPRVAVINLVGSCFMEACYANPFETADKLLENLEAAVVLVDFHAEATSEKLCMGFYLDGRVTAVVGTHTHVQTADARILPGGTAYMTDLGMCGSFNSALGVSAQPVLRRFLTGLPVRFEPDNGACRMSGLLLRVDNNGQCTAMQPVNEDETD